MSVIKSALIFLFAIALPISSEAARVSNTTGIRIVVAKDGSGDFSSIQAAIDAAPDSCDVRTEIFIRNGVYDEEKLIIPAEKQNLRLVGESRKGTVVSYRMYNCTSPESGNMAPAELWHKWKHNAMLVRTTATLTVIADGCHLENLTLNNTAGAVGQALALTVCGDRFAVRNCTIGSYQDTIYLWTAGKRSYFENCLVIGRSDYIFGGGIGFFERCEIRSYGGGWITAPSTPKEQAYGFVFNKCRLTYSVGSPREGDDGKMISLGRPWHEYPKVAVLNSYICPEMNPLGWPTTWNMDYSSTSTDLHLYEYNNRGKGADMRNRSKWAGLRKLSREEAAEYTAVKVLGEDPSNW